MQAFQLGDGVTNCIIPTSGTLMGCLGIAKVSCEKYVGWYSRFLIMKRDGTPLGVPSLFITRLIYSAKGLSQSFKETPRPTARALL